MTADVTCTRCSFRESLNTELHTGQKCSPESAARTRGWRIWSGETVGGTSAEFRLCPLCAGNATARQQQEIAGWDAECETCDYSLRDQMADDNEDGPFTEKDARDWMSDHECEPMTHLIRPASAPARSVA